MSDLSDLYQEVILDHNRRPRNFGVMVPADRQALGHNPLCGDRLTVYLKMDADRIADVRFDGSGCAISKASASLMTDIVKGLPVGEALTWVDRFQALMKTPMSQTVDAAALGKLVVLAGVREFPMRVKCATLPWHTLKAAIAASGDAVRTE